jgi:hypothetical protein
MTRFKSSRPAIASTWSSALGHHAGAGDALGLSTHQLDRDVGGENQLRVLQGLELVSGLPAIDDEDYVALPHLVRMDDEAASVEARVHSYLDANCAFCHGTSRPQGAQWDARFEIPLANAQIVGARLSNDTNDDVLRVIAPGSLEHSQLYLRVSSTDRDQRMPPLGSTRPDPMFLELLKEWISALDNADD